MKIGPTSPLKKTQITGKVKSSGVSSSDFSGQLETSPTEGASKSFPVSSVDSIWAQQEVNENGEKKKRQVRRGHLLIDHLEQIQQALLSNTLNKEQLKTLQEALSREKEDIDDPQLIALLSDIELRAAVELAKYS